jgi:hypothetical protein
MGMVVKNWDFGERKYNYNSEAQSSQRRVSGSGKFDREMKKAARLRAARFLGEDSSERWLRKFPERSGIN